MYTLGDIPRCGAILWPDDIAVVFEGKRFTYREFNERINRFCNFLNESGFKKGDGLSILADNCAKYLEVYFAAAKMGVRVTPINVRLGDDEMVYIVNDCESSIFVVGEGYEEKVKQLKARFQKIKIWVTLDNTLPEFLDYERLLKKSSVAEPDIDKIGVQEDDLAILMYTGGTTGLPKGVMLSHRNSMVCGVNAALRREFREDDSTCFVLPIFHVSWWPILGILLVGGKVCINRKPTLETICRLIENEKCTHMNLVPTLYGRLVDWPDIDKYDLSSLRLMTYAGSPFPIEVLRKCIRKFGNRFAQGYGATETSGGSISNLSSRDHCLDGPKAKYLASAGKPAPISRVKILDENDEILDTGEYGEICVKGKHIMQGYWKNSKLTSEVLKNGWYHTGDMGYMDKDGYLFLVDRKADMIICGGENVYPKEVENVIYTHSAVRECCVVSAPHPQWGEIVQAVVVLHPGKQATEQEIIKHCKKDMAGYKCPKAVAFWSDIPKTIVGKIIKKDVKKTFWEGKERMIS